VKFNLKGIAVSKKAQFRKNNEVKYALILKHCAETSMAADRESSTGVQYGFQLQG
jgi:hypothetical protein